MKRILFLDVDGSERVLDKMPTLAEMQKLVGGNIEHINVMDRVERGRIIFTSMFVNETGLIDGLPRNVRATKIYQRNVRHQFAGAANPFRAASDAHRRRAEAMGAFVYDATPAAAIEAGYKDDPWIAGPAIFFEGWTVQEVDAAS